MRVALVVNRVTTDINTNLTGICSAIHRCADMGVDLAVFPEAAVTGLINSDDPGHDLPLGQPIPGKVTDTLSQLAQARKIHLAIGILEREGSRLYDSAILVTPRGEIAHKYRRITPGWHGPRADPKVYCQGSELRKVHTQLGTLMFLICGDLFDDSLVAQVRRLRPDWLVVPFARCFPDGSYDQTRWEQERIEYIERVRAAGCTALMANYLADKELDGGSFGGALVVRSTGEIVAELPIGREDILYADAF